MSDEPTISIIIPTYNRPDFLEGAIETVLGQTYRNLEVVVVDDGSENTYARDTVEECSDARVRLVEHDENRGLSSARNTGIESANGEYTAFLDDDDRWHEQKLARQTEVLEADPEIALATCCLASVSPGGKILRCERSKPTGDLSKIIYRRNVIGTPSRVVIRSSCFDEIGTFDEDLPTKQDWDLYIRICQKWPIRCLEEILCFRTVHESMSSDPADTERDLMRIRERYREEMEACGMWEESMAAYYRKVGIKYLAAGERREGRRQIQRALEYERTPGMALLLLLGILPQPGYHAFVRTKRRIERLMNACSDRIPE